MCRQRSQGEQTVGETRHGQAALNGSLKKGKKDIWWQTACCSVYILVRNDILKLTGSHDWVSGPTVTTHWGPLSFHSVVSWTFSCSKSGKIHLDTRWGINSVGPKKTKKKQQMLQLSWFDWNTAILLQTQADSFPQTFTLSKRTKKTIYAAAFFFCRETMQMSHLGTAAAIWPSYL